MLGSLLVALVVAQPSSWVEQARVATAFEQVEEAGAAAPCSDVRQARLYGVELLCAAGPTSTQLQHWRAPKRDQTWTVRVDVLRFASAAKVSALLDRFRELVKAAASSTTRPDGGTCPTLSWCETSWVFAGDTVVIASVRCGALRPFARATDELLRAGGPGAVAVVGQAGGRATVVTAAQADGGR